jgi:hypothetical protein
VKDILEAEGIAIHAMTIFGLIQRTAESTIALFGGAAIDVAQTIISLPA